MPTPESTAAFANLVEKRARLNEASKKLHDAMQDRARVAGQGQYNKLQAEWDQALRDLQSATEQFSAVIKGLHHEAGAGSG